MTTITPDSLFFLQAYNGTFGDPVTVTPSWKHRLAGTAFIEADPMDGVVMAIDMNGPTIVGCSEVNQSTGAFEITDIPQKYEDRELLVIGYPRTATNSVAISSRVKPVN